MPSPSASLAADPERRASERDAGARVPAPLMVSFALAVGLGWAWLAVLVAAMLPATDMTALGPGMGWLNRFNLFAGLPEGARAALAVLCTPDAGHFGMPGAGSWGAGDLALVFVMWLAMVLAMMLPSAAPMLAAFDRRARAERIGSAATALVALGYLAVWTLFAVAATAVQAGLTVVGALTPAMAPASLVLAGSTLIAAGLYQLTPMKAACLVRCRVPATALASGWRADRLAVIRFGIGQGIACFGCCWALMAVMFAVGIMNVVWIAILGAIMTVEKAVVSRGLSYAIGLLLAAWGAGLILASPVGARLLAAAGLI
jgi:predicted metal-binding membrane protein